MTKILDTRQPAVIRAGQAGPTAPGAHLAKTKILTKYSTVNQVDRLHDVTKPARAVGESEERERFFVT